MDENKGQIAFQQPDQGKPSSGEGDAVTEQYVTRQQAQELAQQAAEEAYRKAQALIDKGASRLTKQVQERLASLENSWKLQADMGAPVAPETQERLRQRVIQDAFTAQEQAGAVGSGSQAQAPGLEGMDPITAEAYQMMQQAGVMIEQGDPEAAQIDQSSPFKFLRSVEAAIAAKKARTEQRAQVEPQGRIPGMTASTNAAGANYAGQRGFDLLNQYFKSK